MGSDSAEESVSRDVGQEQRPRRTAESHWPDSQLSLWLIISHHHRHKWLQHLCGQISWPRPQSADATLTKSQCSLLWPNNPFPWSCLDPKILKKNCVLFLKHKNNSDSLQERQCKYYYIFFKETKRKLKSPRSHCPEITERGCACLPWAVWAPERKTACLSQGGRVPSTKPRACLRVRGCPSSMTSQTTRYLTREDLAEQRKELWWELRRPEFCSGPRPNHHSELSKVPPLFGFYFLFCRTTALDSTVTKVPSSRELSYS